MEDNSLDIFISLFKFPYSNFLIQISCIKSFLLLNFCFEGCFLNSISAFRGCLFNSLSLLIGLDKPNFRFGWALFNSISDLGMTVQYMPLSIKKVSHIKQFRGTFLPKNNHIEHTHINMQSISYSSLEKRYQFFIYRQFLNMHFLVFSKMHVFHNSFLHIPIF